MRKVLRRIYVALVMVTLVVGVAMLLLFHTSAGRELVRGELQDRLAKAFVGPVQIGSFEGDPFGEMSLHDLAIADADGRPAISVKLLRVRLSLLALAHHRIQLDRVIADGVEVHVSRGADGKLAVAQLVHGDGKRAPWSYELPDVRVANARVVTPTETFEAVELRGELHAPAGQPLVASVVAAASWRGAPAFAIASVRKGESLWIPHALVASHGIALAVTGAELRGQELTGSFVVDAEKESAKRYGLELPDDIRALATLDADHRISAAGRFGTTPMQVIARVDLAAKRVSGLALSDQYALPRGRFGGVATFDLTMGPDGGLPIGTALALLRADVAEAPDAKVGVAFSSDGKVAHVAIDAEAKTGHALFGGDVERQAKEVALRGARLIASGIQLDGTPLRANLTGSGALFPHPDLAVAGRVDAGAVHRNGVSATAAHLVLDARHVPAQPTGDATLHVDGLAKGRWQLGALDARVRTLADGKLAVAVDARDDHLDATVAYGKGTAHVQLGRHLVHAPDGAIWQGEGGAIDVGPTKIAATGLRSTSRFGRFDLAGTYDRRTRALVADATAKSPLVDTLEVHAALTLGRDWRRMIDKATLRATGIHAEPALLAQFGVTTKYGATVDVTADYDHGGTLVALIKQLHGDGLAKPLDLRVELATDAAQTTARVALRGPAGVNLGDVEARVAKPIEEVREGDAVTGTVTLTGAPAPMYSAVLGRELVTGGLLSGKLAVTGTLAQPAVAGEIVATGIMTPPTHGGTVLSILDDLRANIRYRNGELALTLTGKEKSGGTLALSAQGSLADRDHFRIGVKASRFDLAPALALIPGPAAGGEGVVDADLAITGLDLRTAKLSGKLHVVEARLPLSPTIGTLRRATLDATLDGQAAHLAVDGRIGNGTVKGTGTIALVDGVPTRGEVALALRKASTIGLAQPDLTADITGKVHREGKRWLADLVVANGLVEIPRRKMQRLHEVGAPAEMVFIDGAKPTRATKTKSVPRDPTFVLNIELKPTTVTDADMKGTISGKLLISDSRTQLGMLGDITAARGDVDLFGRRYIVERAAMHFDGSTDPQLDIKITHDFTDVSTTTTIRGRFSKPEVGMSSSPAVYSQGQLLGFLLGGEPSGDPRDVTARDRASNAGASLIANEIGTYVRSALPLPIDVVRYQSGSPESSAAVTAGSWITHDLFLAYRRHLEARPDENENESDLEFWLSHHLSVEGTAGDRGYDGIDLLWRTRY